MEFIFDKTICLNLGRESVEDNSAKKFRGPSLVSKELLLYSCISPIIEFENITFTFMYFIMPSKCFVILTIENYYIFLIYFSKFLKFSRFCTVSFTFIKSTISNGFWLFNDAILLANTYISNYSLSERWISNLAS